jgi:DNA-binding transcriptional regulator YdaS (Cro superfamily)
MLTDVDAVIEALGGTAAAAGLAGVSSPAVSNWRERGKITADKFLLISEALKARGADVSPSVFGFKVAEEERS